MSPHQPMVPLPTVKRTSMMVSANSSNMIADAMTKILPVGCLHRNTPKASPASAATNTIPTTRVKSGIPNNRRVSWSEVIMVLSWWLDLVARVWSKAVLAGLLEMPNLIYSYDSPQ